MAAPAPRTITFDAQTLWAAIPEPAMILSEEGTIESVNDLAEKIFKRSSESLSARPLGELLTLKSCELPQLFASLASGDKKMVQSDFDYDRGNSGYRGRLKVRKLDHEHYLSLIDHFHRKKDSESEMDRLRAMNHRKDTCLRRAMHDVNNSMTEMGIMIDSLRSANPAMQDDLKGLARAAEYTKMIMQSISGEVTQGQITLNKVRFSPSLLLQRSVDIFSANAARQRIALSLNIRNVDKNLSFIGDEKKISRIINNLIGNAIKFTPENGEITLALKIKKNGEGLPSDKELLLISVSDSGPGIPEEFLSTIFNEGVQVGEKKELGLGIGLSICKEFTERMKGRISVSNDPKNGGAVFTVAIPLRIACASPLIRSSSDPVLPPVGYDSHKQFGLRVIVADDSDYLRRSLRILLSTKETGYIVQTAENGVKLLEMLSEAQKLQRPIDVVITDLNMKRSSKGDVLEDGDMATAKWRSLEKINQWSRIFFIGLTADETDAGIRQFKESGVDEVLTKGASKNHFLQLIDKYVVQPRLKEDGANAAAFH